MPPATFPPCAATSTRTITSPSLDAVERHQQVTRRSSRRSSSSSSSSCGVWFAYCTYARGSPQVPSKRYPQCLLGSISRGTLCVPTSCDQQDFFFPLLCVRSQKRREDRTKVVCCRSSPLLPNFLATSSSEAGTHSPPPPFPPAMDEPAVWKPSLGSRAPLTRRDCEFAAGGTALACARSVYADKPNTSPPAVSRSPAGPRYHIGNLVHHHLAVLVDLGAAYYSSRLAKSRSPTSVRGPPGKRKQVHTGLGRRAVSTPRSSSPTVSLAPSYEASLMAYLLCT